MSFDWSHYLDIAQDLYMQASNSSHQDASLRCAISRAYYATFHKARLSLYDKWGILVPEDATAHWEIRKEFKRKSQRQIAATLDRMRIDRNKADYNDSVVGLTTMASENLKRANQVISDLKKL
jgi:uncharacterized protein (UPF0332 family)